MALHVCKTNVPVCHCREEQLSTEEFEGTYLKQNVPVVIENCLCKLPCSRWTMEYLLRNVGKNEVTVRGKTNHDNYKTGKAYTVSQTTFQEYVGNLRKRNKQGLTSYMAVQNISKTFPELQEECVLPKYVGKLHNGPFLWVARRGHYEYCHYDPDASMLMMIEGNKQVRLFSTLDHPYLYPNSLGYKGKTIQCNIDCDDPDLESYPEFSRATCHYCVLNPGDILLIPAFWWHQVTSLTDSVSMNAFFGDRGTDNYISRICKPPIYEAFIYWLLNIVEQNRSCSSFQRTLERLPLCVENLILKQFHEVASESQVNFLVSKIMNYLGISELPKFQGGGKNPPPLKIRGLRWR